MEALFPDGPTRMGENDWSLFSMMNIRYQQIIDKTSEEDPLADGMEPH